MIYLDTHVIIWLLHGEQKRLSADLQQMMNANRWRISPIVKLEWHYLYEIGRLSVDSDQMIVEMKKRVDFEICPKAFEKVIQTALALNWTRDPFDRLIVAQAAVDNDLLVTKDKHILENYKFAFW